MDLARRRPSVIPWTAIISFDEHRVHLDVAGGNLKARGQTIDEFLDDPSAFHSNDAVVRARHANISDVGGTVGENAFIGGGDVGVGAHNGGDPPIEIPAESDLLAGSFGVNIDENEGHVRGKLGEFRVSLLERVIVGRQENAALDVQNGVFHAIFGHADVQAGAGITLGEIGGANQSRLVRDELVNLLAIPTVVAAGNHFNSALQQLLGDARGDAEARSGIFAISDDQVDMLVLDDVGKAVAHNLSAGRADDVADKENAHGKVVSPRF